MSSARARCGSQIATSSQRWSRLYPGRWAKRAQAPAPNTATRTRGLGGIYATNVFPARALDSLVPLGELSRSSVLGSRPSVMEHTSRRRFLAALGGGATALWFADHLGAVEDAARHAEHSMRRRSDELSEVWSFQSPEGRTAEAIGARIIPTTTAPRRVKRGPSIQMLLDRHAAGGDARRAGRAAGCQGYCLQLPGAGASPPNERHQSDLRGAQRARSQHPATLRRRRVLEPDVWRTELLGGSREADPRRRISAVGTMTGRGAPPALGTTHERSKPLGASSSRTRWTSRHRSGAAGGGGGSSACRHVGRCDGAGRTRRAATFITMTSR